MSGGATGGAACKLLIADDEPWVRESLIGLIDWEELSIELLPPAADGEDALRKIEEGKPDILVTDIDMPFLGGNELIRLARERDPGLQVIVVSGYSDFAFVRDALLHGAIDYVLKPVTRGALVEVLGKALLGLSLGKEKEREAADLREKLLDAESIMRDREMSDAIFEGPSETMAGADPGSRSQSARGLALDLELEFASFTLVLARLSARRGKGGSGDQGRVRKVKAILAGAAPGARQSVFHNLYSRNEYVLLAELDSERLARVLAELPGRLERGLGSKVSVSASRPYYALDQLRAAYQEARAALMGRALQGGALTGCASLGERLKGTSSLEVRRRVSPELERRLEFALGSRNKELAREVIFDQIGLRACEESGWLQIEAKQTAEYVAAMIYHRADPGPSSSPRSMLAMDNLSDLLGVALDEADLPEARSVLEQLLDEAFGEGEGASASMIGVARRAQDYVEEHYFEDISLTTVASFFRVDRAYLSRAFKQVTGCNIMLAIAKKRIEKAQEYIVRRNMSLTDIADLVGYDDYAYFNRVFRKIAGMSPSEYKASARGGRR